MKEELITPGQASILAERAIVKLIIENGGKAENISFRHHVQMEVEKAIQAVVSADPIKNKLLLVVKKIVVIGDCFAWKRTQDARRMVYEDCQYILKQAALSEAEGKANSGEVE